MPRVYRVMRKAVDDKPEVGRTGKSLGVRIPTDIKPDAAGNVHPNTGGMSVAPSMHALPALLVPVRLRLLVPGANATGKNLHVWRMGSGDFREEEIAPSLTLRPDKPSHGTVQPTSSMPLQAYEAALAATRDEWVIDESGA